DAPVLRPFLPDGDGAVLDRPRGVGDDLVLVDLQQHTEARAAAAGTVGRVEGEEPRRDLADGDAAVGAGVVLRKELDLTFTRRRLRVGGTFVVLVEDLHQPLRHAGGR